MYGTMYGINVREYQRTRKDKKCQFYRVLFCFICTGVFANIRLTSRNGWEKGDLVAGGDGMIEVDVFLIDGGADR